MRDWWEKGVGEECETVVGEECETVVGEGLAPGLNVVFVKVRKQWLPLLGA